MYSNPILSGFYPDPSICRVGEDFYLTCSSFAWFPCLPVFHCRDLVHWKLLGHVFDDPLKINLDRLGVSRGFFAPTIRYHQGLFYLTCTLVDGGGNFVVTAKDPAGPWSSPVWLEQVNGIDPSLFFDNGEAFIIYNSEAPDNKPQYSGHRTIRMRAFDLHRLQVVGEEQILINGGTDLSQQPRWIEGPHLLKHGDWYYLIAAEGGTGYDHAVVCFRSRQHCGPFVPCPHNPLLTGKTADRNAKFPITSTGHADLVTTPDGNWQAVFLGCRPYRGDEYNTGRETFLVPVAWHNGWPQLNPGHDHVAYYYPLPLPEKNDTADIPRSGNFSYCDDFNEPVLSPDWISLRTSHRPWYNLEERKGWLALDLGRDSCSGNGHPSLIARRQQHLYARVETLMEFIPGAEKEKAGMLVFQNEDHFYFLCVSEWNGTPGIGLYRSLPVPRDASQMELIAAEMQDSGGKDIRLIIEAAGASYRFYFGYPKADVRQIGPDMDAGFLSTARAGGFTGCCFALYATSSGAPSDNKAFYDRFQYEGRDPVYLPDEAEEGKAEKDTGQTLNKPDKNHGIY